jgi:hypothetical protein
MEGGRLGHSLDIGKELERESPVQPEEPAVQPETPPAPEPPANPVPEPQPEAVAETHPEADEELPPEPEKEPDPIEEDVEQMLTKDLHLPRSSAPLWRRIIWSRVLILALVILVAGWFAWQNFFVHEPAQPSVQLIAPVELQEPVIPAAVLPEPEPLPADEARDLADIFAEGLRDGNQ